MGNCPEGGPGAGEASRGAVGREEHERRDSQEGQPRPRPRTLIGLSLPGASSGGDRDQSPSGARGTNLFSRQHIQARTLQMYTEASWLSTQLDQKEPNSSFQRKASASVLPTPPPGLGQSCTSVGMLGTEPVKPFSAMVLWELLGELGPEPGALLHTDDTTGEAAVTWACFEPPLLPDLHH